MHRERNALLHESGPSGSIDLRADEDSEAKRCEMDELNTAVHLCEAERDSALAFARRYVDLGLSVIPVIYREKKPALNWKPYQDRRPTQGELREWFHNGQAQNVAVVCGQVSGNLVVVDFDSPEAYSRFFEGNAELERETPVVRTARGFHVWLRTAEPIRSFVIPDLSVDVIAEGKFVLVPPSIHPSGHHYEFVSDLRTPIIVEDFLQAMKKRCYALGAKIPSLQSTFPARTHARRKRSRVRRERKITEQNKLRIIDAMVPRWICGRRNHLTMYLLGLFLKRGIAEDDARDTISRICDLASDEEKPCRLAQVAYHYRKDPRVWPYMKGISGLRELLC